jgi:DNA-binding NarL/FixJ family response regulator
MKTASQTWRLLLVDDHPLVRSGLRAALMMALPKASIEEAGTSAEALHQLEIHRPHLVLLDVNLPGVNGLELARQIRSADRQVKILMVAGEADPWTVREALDAGALGFVAKTSSSLCLSQAVLQVLDGGKFLCEDAQAALRRADNLKIPLREPPGPAVLSQREREILRYLAHGENTKSIADTLQISPKTVETHRQHILRKLGINNVAALARYAIRHGLIAP